jgi:hypothetical protein
VHSVPFTSNAIYYDHHIFWGEVDPVAVQHSLGEPEHNLLQRDVATQVMIPWLSSAPSHHAQQQSPTQRVTTQQPVRDTVAPPASARKGAGKITGRIGLSSGPRLRDAVLAVIAGFGDERRAKPIELVALEAFAATVHSRPATVPFWLGKNRLPTLRDAALEVIAGFGPERRPKHVELIALEAFADAARNAASDEVSPAERAIELPEIEPPRLRRLDVLLRSLAPMQLSQIDLTGYGELRDRGAQRLTAALFSHPYLAELRLRSTGIGHVACSYLSELLAVHLWMRLLEVSHNPTVGDLGAASIAQGVRAARRLDTLEMRACGVGDAGGSSLAGAISARSTSGLTHLDLSFNEHLSSAGVRALRDAVAHNRVIKKLELAGTKAEPALLAAAAAALHPGGKAPPSGAHLWENGIHTPFTLRFAGPMLAAAAIAATTSSVYMQSGGVASRPQATLPAAPRNANGAMVANK